MVIAVVEGVSAYFWDFKSAIMRLTLRCGEPVSDHAEDGAIAFFGFIFIRYRCESSG